MVGRENVIAGTDCGYGTWVGQAAVDPDVVWAKLAALAEGASIATRDHRPRPAADVRLPACGLLAIVLAPPATGQDLDAPRVRGVGQVDADRVCKALADLAGG